MEKQMRHERPYMQEMVDEINSITGLQLMLRRPGRLDRDDWLRLLNKIRLYEAEVSRWNQSR